MDRHVLSTRAGVNAPVDPVPDPYPVPEMTFRERDRDRERDRFSRHNLLNRFALLMWIVLLPIAAHAADLDLTGRISPQVVLTTFPDDSVFEEVFGASSFDTAIDTRIIFGLEHRAFDLKVDYQLIGIYADRLELTRALPSELQALYPHLPTDETRLFDLTHVFTDSGKTAALQRLDRLSVGFSTDHVVVRFGRQAITWGNGMVFAAMDIFNPFDPAAVDKEYKSGDDMLYAQLLQNNGNDIQAVAVFRRDPLTGDLESDQSSLAAKYHLMASTFELDALAAQHYGDAVIGAGFNLSLGGAVWRGDAVATFTDDDTFLSAVTSLSQSWVWGGKNVSGVAEVFVNGFGRSDGCYSPACLAESPELYNRIARGELFNLGRHYLALSAMVEVTPLLLLTPNIFVNLDDPSALAQVVLQNDLKENLLLWSAVNIPIGADGTEFGGAATGIPELYLSSGPSVSIQLVWYW